MEGGEGLVTVVRGLRNSGLAVTLMDAGQYALPESVRHPVGRQAYAGRHAAPQPAAEATTRRDSGVQATDGRYTSTYRMMHCNVTPTSPPELAAEFPPQRAELCPGRENFVIGAAGSGGTGCGAGRGCSFGAGMCCPEKGSVFTPKPSLRPDSFTSSLRKYPNIAQDRSSEVVERLVTYTQAKNSPVRNQPSALSPAPWSDQSSADVSSRIDGREKHPHQLELEIGAGPKRLEESPTRERDGAYLMNSDGQESCGRSTFSRTNDVRCLRGVSRMVRDGIRNMSQHPIPDKLYNTMTQREHNVTDRMIGALKNTVLVNTETQAAAQMTSREVVTSPIPVPSQRTIAVPLTPSPSAIEDHLDVVDHPPETVLKQEDVDQAGTPVTESGKELHAAISNIELSDNKFKQYKRSISQIEVRAAQNELLVIQDLHRGSCFSKFHRKYQSRINQSNTFLIQITKNDNKVSKLSKDGQGYEHRCNRVAKNSKDLKHQSCVRLFPVKGTPFRIAGEGDLSAILKRWINLIPFKRNITFNETFDKELIFHELFNYLKYFVDKSIEPNTRCKLKLDILDMMDNLLMETKGIKRLELNKLVDILLNKVKNIGHTKCSTSIDNNRRKLQENKGICSSHLEKHELSSNSKLKAFVSAELVSYLVKTTLKLNPCQIKDLEDELLDIFMQEISFRNDKRIENILRDYGFSDNQATEFANVLLTQLKESFVSSNTTTVRSETFLVPSNVQDVSSCCKSIANNHDIIVKPKDQIAIHLDNYTTELCRQIDDWLSSLKLQNVENRIKGFRQIIINELAGDIIDRQKYLDLNPTSRGSHEAEVEYLRYQIFKYIGKLAGEHNLFPKDHALDLMKRIRELTPMFTKSVFDVNIVCQRTQKSTSDNNINVNRCLQKNQQESYTQLQGKNENILLSTTLLNNSKRFNAVTMSTICHAGTSNRTAFGSSYNKIRSNKNSKEACCSSKRSVQQLEAEYGQFVKDWVQRVPIIASSSEQESLVEIARVELHNGLWKIVSKFNFDPASYYNPLFYGDLLDDAIEELLDCLPQSPEMKSIRHILKLEFIEKTFSFNSNITAHEDRSFKSKLVKSIITNLRANGIINNEREEPINQELHIVRLAEEYLLYTRFKNENKMISDVFKKKMSQDMEAFIEDLKKGQDSKSKNVNTSSYETEIMNLLERVPMPCETTIREEADEILLRIEVERWYTDLPIISNEDSNDACYRKRQIAMLVTKIKETENNNITDDSETALRNEILKFFEKVSLTHGETQNINIMVDDLINRIKTMRLQGSSHNTKKVTIRAHDSYEDFSENIPFSSSYIETSPKNHATDNELSETDKRRSAQRWITTDNNTLMKSPNKQSRLVIREPSPHRRFTEEKPTGPSYVESAAQWHSLQDSQAQAPRQNVLTSTQKNSIPNAFYEEQLLNNVEDKSVNQNRCPHISDISEKHQLQTSVAKAQKFNSYGEQASNTSYNSQGTRTTGGTLGISQEAGPSGYRLSSSQMIKDKSTNNRRPNLINLPVKQTINKNNQTHKCSIGCQSYRSNEIDNNDTDVNVETAFGNTNHLSVSTNTAHDHVPDMGQSIYTNRTRKNALPSIQNLSNKRPNWAISEQEDRKRLRTFNEDTDEEESDYRCRCVERYWKCRRRPKYMSSEDFDDYPPCMPMLFPYPFFL